MTVKVESKVVLRTPFTVADVEQFVQHAKEHMVPLSKNVSAYAIPGSTGVVLEVYTDDRT